MAKIKPKLSKSKSSQWEIIDDISTMGYRDDSPYRNRESIDINTLNGLIDMSETGMPILANGRYLPPYSGMHQFEPGVVREERIMQSGGRAPLGISSTSMSLSLPTTIPTLTGLDLAFSRQERIPIKGNEELYNYVKNNSEYDFRIVDSNFFNALPKNIQIKPTQQQISQEQPLQQLEFNNIPFKKGSYFTVDRGGQQSGGAGFSDRRTQMTDYYDRGTGKKLGAYPKKKFGGNIETESEWEILPEAEDGKKISLEDFQPRNPNSNERIQQEIINKDNLNRLTKGTNQNPVNLPEIEVVAPRNRNPATAQAAATRWKEENPELQGSSADVASALFLAPVTEFLHTPSRVVNQGIRLGQGKGFGDYSSEISETLGLKTDPNNAWHSVRNFFVDNAADAIVPMEMLGVGTRGAKPFAGMNFKKSASQQLPDFGATSFIDDVGRGLTRNTNELPPPPHEIILDEHAFNLERLAPKNKRKMRSFDDSDIGSGLTLRNNPSRVENVEDILGKNRSIKSVMNKETGESIDLKTWRDADGELYYYMSANMPSSKIKAGRAYMEIEKHIPKGASLLENSSLSYDSFLNILKQTKNPKFETFVKGSVPMNNAAKNASFKTKPRETAPLVEFANKNHADDAVNELNLLLDKYNLPKASVTNEYGNYSIQLPNIGLKKLYSIIGIGGAGALGATQAKNEPYKNGGKINTEWEIIEDFDEIPEYKHGGKTPAWQRKVRNK
jgi:hypothetical protein